LYGAAVRIVREPGADAEQVSAACLSVETAMLGGYGIVGETALFVVRILRAAIQGFINLEFSGGFETQFEADQNYQQLVALIEGGLRSLAKPPRRPAQRPTGKPGRRKTMPESNGL
jgi:hypothetical protein